MILVEDGGGEIPGAAVHDRAGGLVVLVEHWGFAAEQVFAEQLWIQVPDFPDDVPHDGVLVAQLHRDRVDEDGADADDKI